ncbi:hypothetical protein FUA23_05985 [Neolewinella aurantiaca]|uniref:PH (Pleckstrin Homology) domain-containing protein n=1 Tax=Neolewinella aurantiaca TaxID=2602767 RepID=A0A5C7FRN6_9BACT|nr:hypothetical protein [Neolewinella aurantiaca]TXF90642.1 hypothetical protein FUA23_05985 [Neolewinella aurantiaca]
MYRLSSNATLFLKIFLPVFWITIMAILTMVVWLVEPSKFGGLNMTSLRWAASFTLVVGVVSFFVLTWPLKRVETDGEKVYVSNYFRTAFYRWDQDVEALSEFRFLFFRIGVIELNGIGSFGRKMRFVISPRLMKKFREENPGVLPEAKG